MFNITVQVLNKVHKWFKWKIYSVFQIIIYNVFNLHGRVSNSASFVWHAITTYKYKLEIELL